MEKIIKISGMSCSSCENRISKMLKKVDRILDIEISSKKGYAKIKLSQDISDEILREIIDDTGYDVISIENI